MAADRVAIARRVAHARGWVAVVAGAVVVSVPLASCSSPQAAAGPVGSATSAGPSTSASPSASSPSATPTATATPTPPPLDRTATPATTSGTLGPTSLPFARTLGAGWKARVDPGSSEDGYTGNGTPVVARNVRDVTDALLPLGCADEAVYATPMPVPKHAVEADYAYAPTGAHAIGLVLDYGDAAAAAHFVSLYTAALRRCTPGAGGSMVVTVEAAPAGAFASRQVDRLAADTWRELVAPAGAFVRLIAVEGAHTPVRPWAQIAAVLPPVS